MNTNGPVQHPTASGYILRFFPHGWHILTIMHPRMKRLTVPGGHVHHPYESGPAAVLREIREEAGLEVTLLPPPSPRLPADFPDTLLAAPWWTVSMHAGADSVTAEPHIHLDQQYLAITDQDPTYARELDFYWLDAEGLRVRQDILPNTRGQALELLAATDNNISTIPQPEALAHALFTAMAPTSSTRADSSRTAGSMKRPE